MEPGTEPDWMSRLPEPLLHVPLWELAIPGSHDSMSFCLDMSSPVLRSEPTLLRLLDCLLPCCTRPCIQRWSTTQEALEELCVWLESHPREVLILSCSHFECMTEQDHSHLVHFIIALFGPKLCPPQEQPSLSSCWLQRQQLIVSYDEEQTVREHPQLWTSIPYWYAESPEPQKVIQYLDKQLSEERPEKFFAAGLNLTEDLTFVLLHPGLTLRTLTLKGLPPLLRWTNQQRPGPRRGGVNIVCSDFIGLSQFCSIVIGLNYKLLDSLKRLNSSSRFAAVM
ncbi:PI-PLC X domain-containing protein 1-like isoform X2 [Eucyclogobius newberryi]|uniref:PI-PLC X domain-containing protein 1-like isoform X2 n=1 Tax=Eucyclogobius newberryi TaxID=166745 RepID=UPI003B5A937C